MKKFLRTLGIILLIIILIPMIAGFFIRKDYAVEKELVVIRPIEEVFDYVVLLKNQDIYSAWSKLDPNMHREYKGTDGTVGFISAWRSENGKAGAGEQEIRAILPGERIDYELRFLKPFKTTAKTWFTFEIAGEEQTLVKWGFAGRMSYPFNAFLPVMNMEGSLARDFEEGLSALKEILETENESAN